MCPHLSTSIVHTDSAITVLTWITYCFPHRMALGWEAQLGDKDAQSSVLGAWVTYGKINYIAFVEKGCPVAFEASFHSVNVGVLPCKDLSQRLPDRHTCCFCDR